MKYRVALLLGCLTLAGCGATPTPPGVLSVVVGLYPYAYLAEAIGGDHVQVTNLTQPGAEPHDLELTARQVISVATADLMIHEAGFQPAVDAAVRDTHPAHVLEVTAVVPLVNLNPHVWLDPVHMITIASAIADQLILIDPAHEQPYRDNLASLTTTLTQIDQDYATSLETCQRTTFLTTHEAFSYMATRYGLTQIAIAGMSPDTDPSPQRITEIHRIAQEQGLTTVFFETLASPALAQTIAGDLKLRTDVLDPIEGLTQQSRGEDYAQIMAANLAALRLANGCR